MDGRLASERLPINVAGAFFALSSLSHPFAHLVRFCRATRLYAKDTPAIRICSTPYTPIPSFSPRSLDCSLPRFPSLRFHLSLLFGRSRARIPSHCSRGAGTLSTNLPGGMESRTRRSVRFPPPRFLLPSFPRLEYSPRPLRRSSRRLQVALLVPPLTTPLS